MSEWQDVTHRMRRHEKHANGRQAKSGARLPVWQCSMCQTRPFISRNPWRTCGKNKEMQKDLCMNEWTQPAPWPQGGGDSPAGPSASGRQAARGGKGPGDCAPAASWCDSWRMPPRFWRSEESPAAGTENRPSEGEVQERCRIGNALDTLQKAQEAFGHAQQEAVQAQMDLENLMQETTMPVLADPQVYAGLVKTLDTLTEAFECLWNPDVGQPPEHLVRLIQESKALMQAPSALLTHEGGAAM